METVYLVTVSSIAAGVYLRSKSTVSKSKVDSDNNNVKSDNVKLRSLQRVYLPAHLLALFSDWLQGPYVYQLYREYGHGDREIALLFLAGYLSSCFLGGFTGPLADKYGRKRLGQIFCVICIFNCLSKVSPNFYILLTGRILSGNDGIDEKYNMKCKMFS